MKHHGRACHAMLAWCTVLLAAMGVSEVRAGSWSSTSPVTWEAGAEAPRVGLIGDSTLSGVRWADRYGELKRFSVLFDAESCRRTIDMSCWSREQYRPVNALTTLRQHEGKWGEVLVMMTGYNDSNARFPEAVRNIVDEAQRQGIDTVMWMSLRTRGVNYEEPLHRANGNSYRSANRALYALAAELGGVLQVADWAGHSADHPEWFEADGAHLASPGVDAVTDFIAHQLDLVLAGDSVTLDPPPWEDVRRGDEGEPVVEVQQALVKAGFGEFGDIDGVFGGQTWGAVGNFQRSRGLPDHGVVDRVTAEGLGLWTPPAAMVAATTTVPSSSTIPTVSTVASAPTARSLGAPLAAAVAPVAPPQAERRSDVTDALWVLGGLSPAIAWLLVRWLRGRRVAR